MNKMKQIAALTAMLVGVIMYASPAKCAVCFLPDDDGSCGGGDIEISDGSDSDGNKKEEKCEDFPVSATEYEKMKNCFDFTSCTKSKTNEVKYKKGAQKENTTWSNGICCTNGEKYDSAEGKCCPAGGCTHECDAPKEWSSTLRRCECPNGIETTTGICCNDGEHADGAICCPEKKHNDGGVCKCDSQYNTDDDGNCVLADENTCPTGFKADVTCGEGFTKFENPNHKGCYQCQCRNQGTINGKCTNCSAEGYTEEASNDWYCTEACPLNSQAFKPESCTWLGSSCPKGYSTEFQSQNDCGYGQVFMRNGSSKGKTCGVCTNSAGCSSGWATNVPCDTARGFTLIKNIPSQPGCYQCSCQNQGIINGKCTSCDAEGYTYVKNTEGYICSGMCPLSNRYFKSCKKIDNKCSGYTQIKELNSNCYSCSACPDDSKLYKCVENIKAGYTLIDGECKLEMCSGNKVKVICSLSNNGVLSCSSYIPYGAAFWQITRVTIRRDYEQNILYEGGEGCREGSHSLENPRIESLYCDVYAVGGDGSYNREPSRIIEMDKISDNQWSCTTYQ